MTKAPVTAAATAAPAKEHAPKWRRRSLVRVRRPSWATIDQRPRKS